MKTFGMLLCLLVLGLNSSFAQQDYFGNRRNDGAERIKGMVESGQFLFVARYAKPMSGQQVQLTSSYDLRIDRSLVSAWLPYFGRSYHVDYKSNKEGIRFRETVRNIRVDYDERKQAYQVSFDVNTQKDYYRMQMWIAENGTANLTVVSNNRQSISFNGVVEELASVRRSI